MYLLWLSLNVFRKCLRLGRLPHYIIEGVNLFDGKLSKVKQKRLLVYVDSMIKDNLQDVFHIDIDNTGRRLRACSMRRFVHGGEQRRVSICNSISLLLKYDCVTTFLSRLMDTICLLSSNNTFEEDMPHVLRNALECYRNSRLKTAALKFIKYVHAFQNSIQSSECLRLGHVVNSGTVSRFQYSLNSDVASGRLKLASVLYCGGNLQAAVRVLEDVERRYHSNVKAVCGWRGNGGKDIMISGNTETQFAFCVSFFRQELYCIPFILLFEMNRNRFEDELDERSYNEHKWMLSAEVDALPFLYYLQYLTYEGLGERYNQLRALEVLELYLGDNRNKLFHQETAINFLGHCYEMEEDYEAALHYYRESLRWGNKNNAANWHLARVHPIIYGNIF
ncbi:hypothetical protein DPMN_021167 [Dreissena polymorpha]|uniref:Uncharacterized protein n=2 Tax=Dreissena polymorpha TaxID=45954 RepID=A0A9D4SAU1_DREPO|nr:hypothetical protein DPMN_021167 [Dreissena polymorpha]